jgi:hypothetical protein
MTKQLIVKKNQQGDKGDDRKKNMGLAFKRLQFSE